MNRVDELTLMLGCEFCGAGVGEWCMTKRLRRRAQWLHAIRSYVPWQAYVEGSHYERDRLLGLAVSNPEWFAGLVAQYADGHPEGRAQ